MDALHEKKQKLENYLKELGSVAVAFSSGVDSTFLLKVAKEVLNDNVFAVTAKSCSFPGRELSETKAFCEKEGIRQIIVESEELDIDGFRQNPKNRCYLCKHELFTKIENIAKENGVKYVVEGSNMDDLGDYRPGLQAVAELGVKSPLREAKLTKEEIRLISKEMDLPTWSKPSFACLASRFVYGETISEEKHEFPKLISEEIREKVTSKLKEVGFSYVTMDLLGYRTGSMNETILKDGKN